MALCGAVTSLDVGFRQRTLAATRKAGQGVMAARRQQTPCREPDLGATPEAGPECGLQQPRDLGEVNISSLRPVSFAEG